MTRITPLSFPTVTAPNVTTTVIVELPSHVIPLAIMGLEGYKLRFRWASDADYAAGYQAVCDFQRRLLEDMTTSIVEAIDRVYMAVRQMSAGEVFTEVAGEQPPLPLVPPDLPASANVGLLPQLREMQGVLPSGWPFGWGDRPATVADIVNKLNLSDEDEITRVQGVLDALDSASDGASIFTAVRSFFTDGATLSAEGLQLGTLLAGLMANAAFAGLQGGQLDQLITQLTDLNAKLSRLVTSTDGGAEPPPDSNLLAEVTRAADLLEP